LHSHWKDSFPTRSFTSQPYKQQPPLQNLAQESESIYGVSLTDLVDRLPTYQAAARKPRHLLNEQEQIDREIFDFFKKRFDIPLTSPQSSPPSVSTFKSSLTKNSASQTTSSHQPPSYTRPSSLLDAISTPEKASVHSTMPSVTRSVLALGREIPFQELYGGNLKNVVITQQGKNTCYLLSTLDSILHLPPDKAKNILSRIKVHKNGNTYQVRFPGQRGKAASEIITVTEAELKEGGAISTSPGIRLIEKAYLKIPGARRQGFSFDESATALKEIFGEDLSTISIQNSLNLTGAKLDGNYEIVEDYLHPNGIRGPLRKLREFEHHIGEFPIPHEERHLQFKEFIRSASQQKGSADVLTAIHIGTPRSMPRIDSKGKLLGQTYEMPTGGHYYSIRLHESTPEKIVLVNPYNTGKTETIPFEQFMREYNIEGMRLNLG
jgi:hypothetical protein